MHHVEVVYVTWEIHFAGLTICLCITVILFILFPCHSLLLILLFCVQDMQEKINKVYQPLRQHLTAKTNIGIPEILAARDGETYSC